jgi:GTP1/Obg family GTP-binding protein
MSKWLKAFPAMTSLHPFEAALLDLTVGAATYASVLGKVDTLRKALQEASLVGQTPQSRRRNPSNRRGQTLVAGGGKKT